MAIFAGLVVLLGLLTSNRFAGWTVLFLVMTVATCLTGFGFPFTGLLPSHIVGIITLVFSGVAIVALYFLRLTGAWRSIYAIAAMIALYLNVFVLIAQAFQKVPALNALAPTGSETPFTFTQIVVLAVFALLALIAAVRFRLLR